MAAQKTENEKLKRELENFQYSNPCEITDSIPKLNPIDYIQQSEIIENENELSPNTRKKQEKKCDNRYSYRKCSENQSCDSIVDGAEMAENEVKNIPSESKCSVVHKPLLLYF